MSDMNVLDRCRGAMFGLAVGDALGAAVEFRDPGTFPPVTCYRSGGPHSLDIGQWTDDTSMALALADSLGDKNVYQMNLADQCRRYVEWWQEGKYSVNGWCFDIGGTTRTSLSNFMETQNPFTCADPDPGSSGNGSIMRLAPIPIRYHNLWAASDTTTSPQLLLNCAEKSSLTTHASEQCLSACRYMAAVMSSLILGEAREKVLSPDWERLDYIRKHKPLHPLIEQVVAGSYRKKQPPEIKGSGWVVQSLEAALWAFYDAPDFETAVLKAVNLGHDSDTTGAVCGQFAGAYWGESGIPRTLLDGLAKKEMIEQAIAGILPT